MFSPASRRREGGNHTSFHVGAAVEKALSQVLTRCGCKSGGTERWHSSEDLNTHGGQGRGAHTRRYVLSNNLILSRKRVKRSQSAVWRKPRNEQASNKPIVTGEPHVYGNQPWSGSSMKPRPRYIYSIPIFTREVSPTEFKWIYFNSLTLQRTKTVKK